MVALGVAQAVLHVADQWIEPIHEIERAVGAHLQIDGAEVWICGLDHVPASVGKDARAVGAQLVGADALETDRVADQVVALDFGGEHGAGDDFGSAGGPHLVFGEAGQTPSAAGVRGLRGHGCADVATAVGGVAYDFKTPAVEHMAPWIVESPGDVHGKASTCRFVAEDAAVVETHRSPSGFHLTVVEGALLKMQSAAWIPGECGQGVVAVFGAKTVAAG